MDEFPNPTPTQNKYAFWFRGGTTNGPKVGYNESIKKIASFQTVEHFWQVYDHLKRPSAFPMSTEYHLFKDGIHPTWEDPQNIAGGKWMIRLKKGIASRYWEEIILAVIGEQFDVGPEICGAVCSVRHGEDIISVWNRTADNLEAINKIRDQLRRILKLPAIIQIEYKRHQDSLVDKSSYRNPTVVWKAPSTAARQQQHQHGEGGHSKDRGERGGGYQHPGGGDKGWSSSGAGGNNSKDHHHHHQQHHRGEYFQQRGGADHAHPHGQRGGPGGGGAWQGKGPGARGAAGSGGGGGWSRGASLPGNKEGKLRASSDGEALTAATAAAPPVPSGAVRSASSSATSGTGAPEGYKRVPFPGIGTSTAAAVASTAAPAPEAAAAKKVAAPPANAWGRPAN